MKSTLVLLMGLMFSSGLLASDFYGDDVFNKGVSKTKAEQCADEKRFLETVSSKAETAEEFALVNRRLVSMMNFCMSSYTKKDKVKGHLNYDEEI